MAESPKTPRTLAELSELEAQVRVPFDKLVYEQAEPPAEGPQGDYDRAVQKVLFESPG